MILYYAPGACSLADHIALIASGLAFDKVKVDLKARKTEGGEDFGKINPKGYVPALQLPGGELLTENVAILAWVADQAPKLGVPGELGRYRLLEALAYISTELHKNFKPFFTPGADEAQKKAAGVAIAKRLGFLAERLKGDYLFGEAPTVADAYLFVMLMWATKNGVEIPAALGPYFERLNARPAVRRALEEEGLAKG